MNLTNQFLLAMPGLHGDYFADSLTYICEHSEDGAMGLIINRPSGVSLVELLAELGLSANRNLVSVPVLEGGPVALDTGFVLHGSDRRYESTMAVTEEVYLSTAFQVLEEISQNSGPADFLVTLGYSGWAAGQLEDEMQQNVWLNAPASQSVLFELPHEKRLFAAAEALGIDFRLIAARPGHA